MPPTPRTRQLLDGTQLAYFRGTFFRGTSDPGEQAAMRGVGNNHPRLVSGKELSGSKPPDLADLTAEQIRQELIARESFEMARGGGRNVSSHFIPLSIAQAVSKGFGGGGNTFKFDIDFILFAMTLADDHGMPGLTAFVALLPRLPRDIFPLFVGNPAEQEVFAYTGTGIYLL